MDKNFVERFMAGKPKLEAIFSERHPEDYGDLVKQVVSILTDENEYGSIDTERIHEIDDGHHQGTLVYVIAEKGCQPNDYWYVKVGYGSCSGCDTLQGISGYGDEKPTSEQVKDYMTLALHIVQGLKKMDDSDI